MSNYNSKLSDAEWDKLHPLLTEDDGIGGRPAKYDVREVLNGIMYISTEGCRWDSLPRDFPPSGVVKYYFYKYRDSGVLEKINAVFLKGAPQRS